MAGTPDGFRPDTLAVRGGLARSGFDETSEATYLTSGFVYESAEQAEAAFKDEVEHYIYSRYGNPTVTMFEERMRLVEGAEACFATASGMAAVWVALAAWLLFPPRRPKWPARDYALIALFVILVGSSLYTLVWLHTSVLG